MAIFIHHTSDKVIIEPYKEIFNEFGPVYFGTSDKKKSKFFDGTYLNFRGTLPAYIKNNDLIDYAENYKKNIEDIYFKLRKEFFDRYCYYLTRASGDYLGGIYEYLYFFRIHIKAALRFLEENKINYVIMGPPSSGFDNVMCEVVKQKKINFIGLYQIHSKRFFWVQDWNDIGKFSTSLPIFPSFQISLNEKIIDPYNMIRVQKIPFVKKCTQYIKKSLSPAKDTLVTFFHAFNLSRMIFKFNITKIYNRPASWLFTGNKLRYIAYKYINKNESSVRKTLEVSNFPIKITI